MVRFKNIKIEKDNKFILFAIKSDEGNMKFAFRYKQYENSFFAMYEVQEVTDILCSHAFHNQLPLELNGIEYELIPNKKEQKELSQYIVEYSSAALEESDLHVGREVSFSMMKKARYYNWFCKGGSYFDLLVNCEHTSFEYLKWPNSL